MSASQTTSTSGPATQAQSPAPAPAGLALATQNAADALEHGRALQALHEYGKAVVRKVLDPNVELPQLNITLPEPSPTAELVSTAQPLPQQPGEAPWWAQLIVPVALVLLIAFMALVISRMQRIKARAKSKPEKTEERQPRRKPENKPVKKVKPAPEPEPEPESDEDIEAQLEAEIEPEERPAAVAEPAAPEPEPEPVAEPEQPAPAPAEEPQTREGLFARLKSGLAKTRGGLIGRIDRLLGRGKIDSELFAELEEVLVTADIGVNTSYKLLEHVQQQADRGELSNVEALRQALKDKIRSMFQFEVKPLQWDAHRPFVLMVVGVNGVGKTTTIGKLAAQLAAENRKVVLGAADTFRAAAIEQLEVWADRAKAELVKQAPGADPAAVAFDAVGAAKARDADVVIVDTAGRLHTKSNLMEELKKVRRVLDKAVPGAPHETWLVLDANTGQNAINQAKLFNEALELTGLILTKLDGTAKGGVIVGISDELRIPIRYIGIGEKLHDLRPFDSEQFVDALFSE